jgi:hypothetical protein
MARSAHTKSARRKSGKYSENDAIADRLGKGPDKHWRSILHQSQYENNLLGRPTLAYVYMPQSPAFLSALVLVK